MKKRMKTFIFRAMAVTAFCGSWTLGWSQASAPFPPQGPGPVINAPGSPAGIGQYQGPAPAPGSQIYNPGPNQPPAEWGGPWGNGWTASPPIVVSTPLSSPDWQNSGVMNVVACGYDAQGIWRTIPLRVAYTYVGGQYDVNVLAAWNPWTDVWNRDVDVPAFNTTYFLNGTTFNFYTNLYTGTYYFNL